MPVINILAILFGESKEPTAERLTRYVQVEDRRRLNCGTNGNTPCDQPALFGALAPLESRCILLSLRVVDEKAFAYHRTDRYTAHYSSMFCNLASEA